MADDFDVDERDVFIAQNSRLLQMAEDDRCPLSFAHLDVFGRLRITLVWRCQCAPEEVGGPRREQYGEDDNGEERLQVLPAAAALRAAPGYDRPRCSSR